MERSSVGLILVVAGAVLILVGVLAWTGALSWFGRLPGDIRVERPGFRLQVPVTSMVLLSVILSVVLTIVAAIFRRFR